MPDSTPDRVEELRREYDDRTYRSRSWSTNVERRSDANAAFAALRAEIERPWREAVRDYASGPNYRHEKSWNPEDGEFCGDCEQDWPCSEARIRALLSDAPVEVAPRETPTCKTCGDSQTVDEGQHRSIRGAG